jgi:hypothetical protein
MTKLATYKRLTTGDFEEDQQAFVEQLAFPINDGFNELYFAMNGRVDLKNNLFCTVKDVDLKVKSDGIPINTASFSLDKDGKVSGCQVIYAANQDNSAIYPTSQPFISFTQNGKTVTINHISGLQSNQRYIVRIVAYLD